MLICCHCMLQISNNDQNLLGTVLQNEDFADVMFVHCSDSTTDEDDIDSVMLQAYETTAIDVFMDCVAENCPDVYSNPIGDGLSMTCNSDDVSSPEQSISFYLAGYVAYRLKKFTSCEGSSQSLVSGVGNM